MIKNNSPDKSGNPESLKKVIATVEKLLNQDVHSWQGFAEGILQFVLFTVLWFKWSVKKKLYSKGLISMKIIIAVIPTDSITNLLLLSFCPFLQTKNKH